VTKLNVLTKTIEHARREEFPTHWPWLNLTARVPTPPPASTDPFPLTSKMASRALRKERIQRPTAGKTVQEDIPSKDSDDESGIEHEVKGRLQRRFEKRKKNLEIAMPTSARLPASVAPALPPTPHSAREIRELHWTIEESSPICFGLFGRHSRAECSTSGMGSRSEMMSVTSPFSAISRGASPRWDSSPAHIWATSPHPPRPELRLPEIGPEIKLPAIPGLIRDLV
jgi:hypothetical protein